VAWLTKPSIIAALAKVPYGVSIIVQKKIFCARICIAISRRLPMGYGVITNLFNVGFIDTKYLAWLAACR
jgi:hypothetical protein